MPPATPDADEHFESLLHYLKATRGFDFTGYKRPTLQRRIWKRMGEVGIESWSDYQDHLEVHPDEFTRLFNVILINVTGFFRDRPSWDALGEQMTSRIEAVKRGAPIRAWSAGCASGEEAYTIAMVFGEALGLDALKDRVKVYATDVDEDALTTGRQAIYTEKEIESVPEDLRERYFTQTGSRYTFRRELRHSVVFGRHDLVQDAPISKLDLLACRNTLMYFNAETQGRIVRNFHFALRDDSILFLGRAETLLSYGDLFAPLDLRNRLFSKVVNGAARDRLPAPLPPDDESVRRASFLQAAVDAAPVGQILVAADGRLLGVNEEARRLLDLRSVDLGVPIQDLEASYRPIELRSRIDAAYAGRRPVNEAAVERVAADGSVHYLDVTITPVFEHDDTALGAIVTYVDVTASRKLQIELERSRHELQTAHEEVQATNEELQSTNEELETTNEELQSTVEELETTNEELQSANEELETMNEELMSTNAEVQAVNDELRQRTEEAHRSSAFSRSLTASLKLTIVAVDTQVRVISWSDGARDVWGLREDEVLGAALDELDVGFPVSQLVPSIDRCLTGEEQTITVDAVNRRGRTFRCTVACHPLVDDAATIYGAVLVMRENGA